MYISLISSTSPLLQIICCDTTTFLNHKYTGESSRIPDCLIFNPEDLVKTD